MHAVYAVSSNITTAAGCTSQEVWEAVVSGKTAVRRHEDPLLSETPFWASRITDLQWEHILKNTAEAERYTRFEQMAIYSARQAISKQVQQHDPEKTVLVLATTKGNIADLNITDDERNSLSFSARLIAAAIGLRTAPVVISHACVSGVTALNYGLRLLQHGRYEQAVIVGADRFTRFVLSGFQSFQAVANGLCRPFDIARNGINLGEAAATIILSTASGNALARLCSGATSNDANHISGPSRTGEELALAITRTLAGGHITPDQVDMISAHGTATLYNDEMEAKAFAAAGLLQSEVHSLKGYVGHTLGAAGILESAVCIEALQHQQLVPSVGFDTSGVSEPVQVTRTARTARLRYVLKTASGFGGCNAAVLWAAV